MIRFAALPLRLRALRVSWRFSIAVCVLAACLCGSGVSRAYAADKDDDAGAAVQAAPLATISLPAFQSRLIQLDQLVAKCQQRMTPTNCDRDAVGPDVQLALPAGVRQIRLNWLRGVLTLAAKADTAKAAAEAKKAQDAKAKADKSAEKKSEASASDDGNDGEDSDTDVQSDTRQVVVAANVEFPPTPIEQRLSEARQRLANEMQWASGATNAAQPALNAAPARQALDKILSAKEYKTTVVKPSLKDRLLEKVARWINQAIGKLVNAGSKSKWIGTTAEIAFGVVICVALVWFLIRLEKQGRFKASMIRSGPGSGAASARDWQLWLQDAQDAAARQAWRDAIHLLYWASISRLEGSGLWPADRARTPREYLALLSQESRHRPDLGSLTRSFERTWYAGRVANEADFHAAEQLAAKLGAGSRERAIAPSGDEVAAR